VLDAGLIAAAPHVEHYEWRAMVRSNLARLLDHSDHASASADAHEEGETDKALTQLAETINVAAETATKE